jgi:hypothetical protein
MSKENMTIGNSDENTDLTVEILSITALSQISANLDGKPVKLPNWEPGINIIDGYGSKRPGVLDITAPGPYNSLEVRVKVKGLRDKETRKLSGKLADLTFNAFLTGDNSPGKIGKEMTVHAVPENIPDYFKQASGDMEWFLASEIEPFEKTRLEIYWIYGYPGIMYKRGVWVEVLRLLTALCTGLTDKEKIIQQIVNYCHAWTPLQYDSKGAAARYAEAYWGGYFELKAFLEQAHLLCNCYDQAGALQTLIGALGIKLTWIYMEPFGFINRTSLIGRGATNNPVFLKNLTPEIVAENDPNRTQFGAHSFCLREKEDKRQVILDACLGPILADVSPRQYLEIIIDTTTDLYEKKGSSPGDIDDMYTCTGIVDIHAYDCLVGACEKLKDKDKRIKEFKKKIDFESIGAGINADTGVCCNWENPLRCPELEGGKWKIKSRYFHPGCETAAKEWILVRGNEHLKIKVFVSNQGSEGAKNRLLTMAASTALSGIPFEKKTKPHAKGHLHVFHHRIEIWVYYNVCFLVNGRNASIDLLPVISWLQEQAEQSVVEKLSDHLPFIKKITPDGGINIKVDQEAAIRVFPDEKYEKKFLVLEPFFSTELLRLVEEKPLSLKLKFKGISSGKTHIYLVLVNKQNLLCSPINWEPVNIT